MACPCIIQLSAYCKKYVDIDGVILNDVATCKVIYFLDVHTFFHAYKYGYFVLNTYNYYNDWKV